MRKKHNAFDNVLFLDLYTRTSYILWLHFLFSVVSSKAKVWAITRDTYQTIMMKDGIQRQMDALKVINK